MIFVRPGVKLVWGKLLFLVVCLLTNGLIVAIIMAIKEIRGDKMNTEIVTERIAYYGWNSQNIFTVSSLLEYKEGFWKEAVILEAREGRSAGEKAYDKNNGIRMLADASDLRALSYAIKSLVKNKKTSYKKFTDPKRAKNGNGQGKQKMLTLGVNKDTYYLNFSQNHKIGVGFDMFKILAIADQLEVIAECTEKMLFRKQIRSSR